MKIRLIILSLFIAIVCLCNAQKKYVKISNYNNYPWKFETELKKKVLYKGDTIAYEELKKIYLDTVELREDFFSYALLFSKKYGYSQAYYDVFTCFMDFYPYKGRNMDNETASMTITFLLDAADHGHKQAKVLIQKYNIIRGKKNNRKYIKRIIEGEGLPLYWKG
jgi:hypothetical protein